jgi:hypothetical protein
VPKADIPHCGKNFAIRPPRRRSPARKEAHMLTSRARQELPALSIGSGIGTVLGLPPKDPDNDDDEDEEDDEDESEEEPAVVREPDE